MKKIYFLLLFSFISTINFAEENNYDITTPFKIWLLNNEAKAMSELGRDEMLLEKSSSPFSILPDTKITLKNANDQLWEVHRKIYNFINETQKIYNLAKKYGNGKFSVEIKKSRPEIWSYSALSFIGFSLPDSIYKETRKAFLKSLFIAIGLDTNRDRDLSNRLKIAIRNLKDEEFRLTQEYISIYKALYPSERSIIQLEQFIDQGSKKPFATGLTEIINSVKYLSPEKSNSSNDDLLGELETLTESSTEEQSKPITEMEAPDPEASNIYDIW